MELSEILYNKAEYIETVLCGILITAVLANVACYLSKQKVNGALGGEQRRLFVLINVDRHRHDRSHDY